MSDERPLSGVRSGGRLDATDGDDGVELSRRVSTTGWPRRRQAAPAPRRFRPQRRRRRDRLSAAELTGSSARLLIMPISHEA
uniref:Uncharacterized protein n=1 Tax=Angiostrongylus cantonensis TaxID=6313 RepID=A0A0K0DL91_ANGCA